MLFIPTYQKHQLLCYPHRMEDYPYLIEAISHVITRLREEAGLSKRKLAEIAGIDRVYLLQIEQGKYRPTLNSIFLIADALGLSPALLVDFICQEQQKLSEKTPCHGSSTI